MKCRPRFLFVFLCIYFVAPAARGDDLPAIGATAITTPSRSESSEPDGDLGLEMRWLPLEAPLSLTDYVGRNLPAATFDGDGRLMLRGGLSGDTRLEVDGLRVKRLAVPLALVERLEVASAGYGAGWGDVLGGVVGVTTRTGGNRFRADADVSVDFRSATGAGARSRSVPTAPVCHPSVTWT